MTSALPSNPLCMTGNLQMSAMRKLPVVLLCRRRSLAPSGKRQHFNQILIFRILLDSQVETGLLGPVPTEGRLAIVTKRGTGCGGRGGAVDEWR
jgi:hypothetical protein